MMKPVEIEQRVIDVDVLDATGETGLRNLELVQRQVGQPAYLKRSGEVQVLVAQDTAEENTERKNECTQKRPPNRRHRDGDFVNQKIIYLVFSLLTLNVNVSQ